jgi:glycosyltransferase involved in cell wall biosynthesis
LYWCRQHGVPVFITGDSNIADDRATGWRRAIKRAFVSYVVRSLATGVMPFGSRGAAYFRRYGANPRKIFFVPLEPDYRQLSHPAPTPAVTALRFDPNRRRLLYSGRLVSWKRVDLLIDAFAAIASQRADWDLVIVGDGPERNALVARVPPALNGRVIWTGGFRAAADVAALYALCDVLVLPSDREPWALVINEAAAAGLAIVSSTVPGAAAELVRDGVNGRIFSAGDLQALIQVLRDVTSADKIDAVKAGSSGVLADWRRRADPIAGLRKAVGPFATASVTRS